jgi:predicted MFS family arabinose efflux permease
VTAAVGPVAAAVIDVVHPGLRATAVSLLVVVQGVCGLAVGPVLAGALADRWGLTAALAVIPALGVVAAGALRWGSRSCADDRAAAALTPGMPDPVVGRATGGEG